jgi:hypothetical protein
VPAHLLHVNGLILDAYKGLSLGRICGELLEDIKGDWGVMMIDIDHEGVRVLVSVSKGVHVLEELGHDGRGAQLLEEAQGFFGG